jgi:hypothetical protein
VTHPEALTAAALQQAAALLNDLTAQQLEDLACGRGQLVFQPDALRASRRATSPRARCSPRAGGAAVTAAVEAINQLATPGEVADYLQMHDRTLTVPVLKEVARALGPTVSASAGSKAELKRNIVAGTAGFRQRSAAMSRGAWA